MAYLRDINAGPKNFWTGLSSPFAQGNVTCDDSTCDDDHLFWNDGTQFQFDDTILDTLLWSVGKSRSCSIWLATGYDDFKNAIHSEDCWLNRHHPLCYASCTVEPSSTCPNEYPFSFNNGNHCCVTFERNDDTCDNGAGKLRKDDPENCCITSIPCPNGINCNDNPMAKSKLQLLLNIPLKIFDTMQIFLPHSTYSVPCLSGPRISGHSTHVSMSMKSLGDNFVQIFMFNQQDGPLSRKIS